MISPAGVAVACASRAGEVGRYICTVFLPSTRPAPRNPPRAPPARPCSPRSAGQGKRWRSSQRPGGTDGETPWLAPTHHDSPTRRLVFALPQAPGQAVGERIRPAVTRAGAAGAATPRERVLEPRHAPPRGCAGCWYPGAASRVRIDSRRYANTALRYIIRRRRTVSPQLQTEAVLRRRVRTPAGRGAEPCGVARHNTEDRRKGRARCGCKEAMLKSCRRGAHHSGFCWNSTARPQRQRVLITASAANQRQSRM